MRTLLKILQSDSSALWIKFYSLMYEAENVKNIVECCPDTMMEGRLPSGREHHGNRMEQSHTEKDIVLWNPAHYKNTSLGLQSADCSLLLFLQTSKYVCSFTDFLEE